MDRNGWIKLWAPLRRPSFRHARVVPLILALVGAVIGSAEAQVNDRLAKRWVGSRNSGTLHLDFYGDTMLVVNDRHVASYSVSNDSLVVAGDTSFAAHFRFALDKWLILQTEDGAVITMSEQARLARPLRGQWIGAALGSDSRIELRLSNAGTARWRRLPTGNWTHGEWDRFTRVITFTWLPDSTEWTARYDPGGNSLLFDETIPGEGTVILRRVFRRGSN